MSLREEFIGGVRELLSMENHVARVLPGMSEAAADPHLKAALAVHSGEAREQLNRLKELLHSFEEPARAARAKGMWAVLEDGYQQAAEQTPRAARDVSLLSLGQRAAFQIAAGYETAIGMAEALGEWQAARILERNLDSEIERANTLRVLRTPLLQAAAQEGLSRQIS
jgi:ferritin-like metal-binding protein YciE